MSISYVLRTCNSDLTSRNGFKWLPRGIVECPDFEATPECGAGLHGFLDGCGNGGLASWEPDAQWLLVAVPTDNLIDLDDKVKFPRGEVLFSSQDRLAVIAELERLNPEARHKPVIGAHRVSLKNNSNVLVGYRGTATAGDCGTATAGKYGTATAGFEGTATAGDYGTATAGDYGTATVGFQGTATAGYRGTATAGREGTATAGDYGTAIVGAYGKAKAELDGNLIFRYNGKYKIFYVDGKKVKADTLYRLDDKGKLVLVE